MRKIQSYSKKTFEQYDRDHMVCYLNERQTEVPARQEGEEPQTAYEYDELVVGGLQVSKETVVAALVAAGVDGLDAEVSASDLMLRCCQQGVGAGDNLALAKEYVVAKIMAYDSSSAVNGFTIGGEEHWIPREKREMFQDRLTQEVRRGHDTVSLDLPDAPAGAEPLTLGVAVAQQMLDRLNDYATDCYDRTQAHKRAVAALTTLEDVLAYDYTTGYPEKLSF